MGANHSGDLLHWLDFGAHHAHAPALQYGLHHVDLLALQNLAQLLFVGSGPGHSRDSHSHNQGIEIGRRFGLEFGAVFEQCAALAWQQ